MNDYWTYLFSLFSCATVIAHSSSKRWRPGPTVFSLLHRPHICFFLQSCVKIQGSVFSTWFFCSETKLSPAFHWGLDQLRDRTFACPRCIAADQTPFLVALADLLWRLCGCASVCSQLRSSSLSVPSSSFLKKKKRRTQWLVTFVVMQHALFYFLSLSPSHSQVKIKDLIKT